MAKLRIVVVVAVVTGWLLAVPGGPAEAVETCFGLAPTITGAGLILGTPGADVIIGSSGPDVIIGNGGADVICGGDGDDVIFATFSGTGQPFLRVDGGTGNDRITCDAGPTAGFASGANCMGGPGNDTVVGIGVSFVRGGPDNDVLVLRDCRECILFGDEGNDTLILGPCTRCNADGGEGDDIIMVPRSITLDSIVSGGPGNDRIVVRGVVGGGPGISVVNGGDGNDEIAAESVSGPIPNFYDAQIHGGFGNDRITAGRGQTGLMDGDEDNDAITLGGGTGNRVDGGSGLDVCRVAAGAATLVEACETQSLP